MKTVKFRIWNGTEMVYDIVTGKFGTFYVNPENGNGLNPNDTASLSTHTTKYRDDTPLMQFIGLNDMHSKEIYEDDIVKVYGEFQIPCDDRKDFETITYRHIGRILFNNGSFIFRNYIPREQLIELRKTFDDISLESDIDAHLSDFLRIEVLGNVYQNQEIFENVNEYLIQK